MRAQGSTEEGDERLPTQRVGSEREPDAAIQETARSFCYTSVREEWVAAHGHDPEAVVALVGALAGQGRFLTNRRTLQALVDEHRDALSAHVESADEDDRTAEALRILL